MFIHARGSSWRRSRPPGAYPGRNHCCRVKVARRRSEPGVRTRNRRAPGTSAGLVRPCGAQMCLNARAATGLVMTRSTLPRPAPDDLRRAGCPPCCAPIQHLPHVRRVTGWAWSSVYSGATEPETPGGTGQRVVAPQARTPRDGGCTVCVKSVPPWPRVPRPGATRPGSARKGSARSGAPSNLRGQEVANRELRAANSGVPSLALSGPAIHERTGSPAPKRYLRRGRVSACPRGGSPAELRASEQGVGSAGESAGVRRRTRSFP